jgi:hypothetical protein
VVVSHDANKPANPKAAGRYTIISPGVDTYGYLAAIRNDLENESGRLNLNALLVAEQNAPGSGRQLLMACLAAPRASPIRSSTSSTPTTSRESSARSRVTTSSSRPRTRRRTPRSTPSRSCSWSAA